MFGADAAQMSFQFESQTHRNRNRNKPQDNLEYLFPKFIHQLPWLHTNHNGSTQSLEDFILIAEFSEQEGPRPVIVIPKDGGQNFNQNDFSVRILAVDHQSSIVEGFEQTEDAQVVMTDPETDAHAFIHHIVLNDIQARGYVRPFCISYVTSDPLKIMKCYEEISSQMKKVARLMKYGNRLVFMRDLEKFQEDLSYTKAHLLISQSRTLSSPQGDNDLLNALNTLRQCMEEVKDILSNLKPLLQLDTDLSERFHSYERELKCHRQQQYEGSDSSSLKDFDTKEDHFGEKELSGSCTDRTSPIFSLFSKCKNQKPKILDVSTIRGKRRFDRSLRGLHELCSWGAKEGLQKLRAFREFLSRDLASIYVDELDMTSLVPDSGVLCFGSNTVGANFMSTYISSKSTCCSRKKLSYCSTHQHGLHSLGSVESFKSVSSSFHSFYDDDTMYSAKSSMNDTLGAGVAFNREVSINSEAHDGSDFMDVQNDQEFMFHHDNSVEVNDDFENTETVCSSLVDTLKFDSNDLSNSSKLTSGTMDGLGLLIGTPVESSVDGYYTVDIDVDLVCSAKGCKCKKNDINAGDIKCNNNQEKEEKPDDRELSESDVKAVKCTVDCDKGFDNVRRIGAASEGVSVSHPSLSNQIIASLTDDSSADIPVLTEDPDDDKSVIPDNDSNSDSPHNVDGISGDNSVTEYKAFPIEENEQNSRSAQGVYDASGFMLPAKSLDSELDDASIRGHHSNLTGSQSSFGMSYSSVNTGTDNSRRRKWRFLHSSKYLFDDEYTMGQCLQRVLPGYNNLHHVAYSLLSGRPVVVMGTRKQENFLREIVQALSVFVPYTPRAGSVGLLCQSRQMKMSDIHKFQLRGLIRSDKKSVDYLIPKTCRRYVTLVDLEKLQVHCQPYQGVLLNFLLSICNKKKVFKSDAAVYSYIQLCLEEISNKAFSFYHRMTCSDSDLNIHGSSVLHKSVMLEASSEKYLGEAGIRNSDCRIVKHLAEVVKIQQIEEEFKSKYLTDAPAYPFSVNYQTIQTFKL